MNPLRLPVSIVLPILMVGAAFFPATAQDITKNEARDAISVIASAHAIESACRTLDASEREELARYAAMAEVAGAHILSMSELRATVSKARAKAAAGCTPEAENIVSRGLSVGRKAAENTEQVRRAEARAADQPRRARQGRRQENQAAQGRHRQTARGPREHSGEIPRGGGLAGYGEVARAYYVELRCRHMPYHQAHAFWERVALYHERMLRGHGGRAVLATLRRAEVEAERLARHCGRETRHLVHVGYRSLARGR